MTATSETAEAAELRAQLAEFELERAREEEEAQRTMDELESEALRRRAEAERWKGKLAECWTKLERSRSEVDHLQEELRRAHAYIGEQALKKH